MNFLFGGPKLPPVAAPPPKPEITPEDTAKLEEDRRNRAGSSRGRRSTLVTGGLGVQGDAAVKKTRLGGY